MNNMITSKDIITKTGISRATLNNYINLGILPRPVVGPARPGMGGVKQIGYFPPESLERVYTVKLLKSRGKTMEEITAIMTGEIDEAGRSTDAPEERREGSGLTESLPKRRSSDAGLRVTICDIQSPAYLINRNFEVEWVNSQAEELVFSRNVRSLVDSENRNIFKLFLDKQAGVYGENMKELASLHLTVLQNVIGEEGIPDLYKGITGSESKLLLELYRTRKVYAPDMQYHLPFAVSSSREARKTYWVHTMTFREGTFFVYIPDDGINSELLGMLEQREKVINELLRRRMPSLVSLCVLIADLQDSVKISAELLPAQYFELINGLWEQVGPTLEKHRGIYGKHVGDGMLYYFIDKPGENYLTNCINCAVEIREIMKNFSNKWKGIKGWANDLYLNTGINEGQEFFGTIHSANTVEFTALGDTINIAARLSEFASNGEIWTTKNVISKLSQEERSSFRFGVHHRNHHGEPFIRESFSRVSDLITPDTPHYHRLTAIAGLPITEIKERINPSFI
ncbi:MAG: adenylate/guanylate cyclase domain-containing protein [Desulfobulbaceae bacterium]|nr:adenylate/guanylate cyclase domain-containing protein [Desulfobulbaceae bacterium]